MRHALVKNESLHSSSSVDNQVKDSILWVCMSDLVETLEIHFQYFAMFLHMFIPVVE